jgi:hypothetical protein
MTDIRVFTQVKYIFVIGHWSLVIGHWSLVVQMTNNKNQRSVPHRIENRYMF